MTRTLPWRLMILHLSHIFLTEGRTFIVLPFGSAQTDIPTIYSPSRRRKLTKGWFKHTKAIAGEQPAIDTCAYETVAIYSDR